MKESLALFVLGRTARVLTMIEHDIDNVRSAWRHHLSAGDAAGARTFVEGLWYLYECRGWYPAGISLFGEALEAFPADEDDPEVVKLRALAGAMEAGNYQRLARQLGVEPFRPWDLSVDPKGRPPLKPFTSGADLMKKSVAVFQRLDPRLAKMLATLGDGTNTRGSENGACLDLDSRKGKSFCMYRCASCGDISWREER